MILLLILGAIVVVAVMGLALLWVYLDGKVSRRGEDTTQEMNRRLVEAENEIIELRRRIEDLETIAASSDS
ncbi:MAG: hypothetical protein OXF06_05805 [Bacteroidetes bacterium]|nr:hypothetical protein [Bacteroidota bacterium]MCY4224335.1 hypothetical protein [Bacteroidota bacterium]